MWEAVEQVFLTNDIGFGGLSLPRLTAKFLSLGSTLTWVAMHARGSCSGTVS
jgi:hypothetical protein